MSSRALQRVLRMLPAAAEALAARPAGAAWSAAVPSQVVDPFLATGHSRRYSSLSDAIKSELAHEEESSSGSDSALDNVPAGWSLDIETNDTTMVLSKQHGKETVSIRVSILGQEEGMEEGEAGEDDESSPQYSINFALDCKKGSEVLRFSLVYLENDTEGPEIEHASLIPEGMKDDEDEEFYTGPTFSELDEQVQEQFAAYVADRGVDADLCQYLCRLVYDKEQRNYMQWLQKVSAFVR